MIGNMAVRVTADRANFPLGTLFVRRGSAANVALVGVPVRAGVDIESVAVRVENVDGETADFAARQLGGVWVVDLPAAHFSTVGSVVGGVAVFATGTGADGETERTWNVGVGDLEVLPADADAPAPTPGQEFWPLRMFDAAPTEPTKYNAYLDGNALKIWDGAAWVEISGGSIDVDAADLRYRIAEAGYATTGAELPGNVTVRMNGEVVSYEIERFSLPPTDMVYWRMVIAGVVAFVWKEDGTSGVGGTSGTYKFYDANGDEMQTIPNLLVPRALADRTVNLITAADGTASIDIELPDEVYEPEGVRRARDFFVDVDNSANTNDLALEFPYIGSGGAHGFALVPLADETIGEITTIGAGERARLYFTETPYYADVSRLPVIQIARVTLGDFVTSTATQGGN